MYWSAINLKATLGVGRNHFYTVCYIFVYSTEWVFLQWNSQMLPLDRRYLVCHVDRILSGKTICTSTSPRVCIPCDFCDPGTHSMYSTGSGVLLWKKK